MAEDMSGGGAVRRSGEVKMAGGEQVGDRRLAVSNHTSRPSAAARRSISRQSSRSFSVSVPLGREAGTGRATYALSTLR